MKILRHPLFMTPNPESELEQFVDRELKTLPPLQAPVDLVPGVLAMLAARERRPWWQQPVVRWPWPARLGFLVGTTGLSALLLYFTWGLTSGASFDLLADEVATVTGRLELIRSLGGALGGAVLALARSAGPWLPWAAAGVLGVSYLTTVALGPYCYRLALGRE